MNILHVVGARPNFPKLAPVHSSLALLGSVQRVVHTGQHYDDQLLGWMVRDLGLPPFDVNLGVGSGSHAIQTARIMERIEPIIQFEPPDWVVVYGDVNSTIAVALVAAKCGVRIAHVEAGLRSFDRAMPEEINRILTDRLSALLFAPSRDAVAQLLAEGEPPEEIEFVGNVMVDSLLRALPAARRTGARSAIGKGQPYVVATIHRPSNTDDPGRLRSLIRALDVASKACRVFLFCHPRTRASLAEYGLSTRHMELRESLPYLEMIDALEGASCVVTDSGGIQEEATVLGVPCLTVRANTERPVTVTEGTNRLIPDPEDLAGAVAAASSIDATGRVGRRPEGWDGRAAERIAAAFARRA